MWWPSLWKRLSISSEVLSSSFLKSNRIKANQCEFFLFWKIKRLKWCRNQIVNLKQQPFNWKKFLLPQISFLYFFLFFFLVLRNRKKKLFIEMMMTTVPEIINSLKISRLIRVRSVIFILCLNAFFKLSTVCCEPTSQQEQELLLLDALSKRQPSNTNYGSSNSLMDMLGRSM